MPENALTQDVKTRWRSTHAMTNSLRISSEALLLYDVRNPGAAKGFVDNRFSMEDWAINNQTAAVLAPLAGASQYLEGKSYPTVNLVLPSMYGCIEHMEPSSAVRQPWDGKVIRSSSLRPECQEAREEVHADLVRRWKTDIPEALKRYYMIATICDPRQKALRFPGLTSYERLCAREWFVSEYHALWGPAPQPAPAASCCRCSG